MRVRAVNSRGDCPVDGSRVVLVERVLIVLLVVEGSGAVAVAIDAVALGGYVSSLDVRHASSRTGGGGLHEAKRRRMEHQGGGETKSVR